MVRQRTTAAERVARLRKEQYREARRMAGIIILSSSFTASHGDGDEDAPGAADAYTESSRRDPKGKRPTWRKW